MVPYFSCEMCKGFETQNRIIKVTYCFVFCKQGCLDNIGFICNNNLKIYWWIKIVYFLPVFGCLGDSAWNVSLLFIPWSWDRLFCSNQDFSAKGVVKGVCVHGGSARDHSRGWKVEVGIKKTIPRSRFKHRDTILGKFP